MYWTTRDRSDVRCLALLAQCERLREDFCAGNHRLLHELPDLPRPLRRLGASVARACACAPMHGSLPSRCSSAIATVAPLRSRRSRSGRDSIVMGRTGHFRCCCCSFELVTVRIADLACMPPSPVAFPGASISINCFGPPGRLCYRRSWPRIDWSSDLPSAGSGPRALASMRLRRATKHGTMHHACSVLKIRYDRPSHRELECDAHRPLQRSESLRYLWIVHSFGQCTRSAAACLRCCDRWVRGADRASVEMQLAALWEGPRRSAAKQALRHLRLHAVGQIPAATLDQSWIRAAPSCS